MQLEMSKPFDHSTAPFGNTYFFWARAIDIQLTYVSPFCAVCKASIALCVFLSLCMNKILVPSNSWKHIEMQQYVEKSVTLLNQL